MKIKFPALLAATGLMVSAPLAIAQDTEQSGVTQFLSDSVPAECTLTITTVSVAATEQSVEEILAGVPTTSCDAVSGTDDGDSKNFNFLNLAGSNYYKIITSSAPVATGEGEYAYSVEGVKVVPLTDDGAAPLSSVEYLYPSDDQVCQADAPTEPRSVTCTFEVSEGEEIMVGYLTYVW